MPGTPGFPDSYNFLDYHNKESIDGSSESRFEWNCAIADFDACATVYFESVDANDINLQCMSVEWDYQNHDPKTGMIKATAHFVPSWKLQNLLPNQPFRVKMSKGSMSFTLRSGVWTWEASGGSPLANASIAPMMTVSCTNATLFGTRTGTGLNGSIDLSAYDGYVDKISSDRFLGRAAECWMWKDISASPRQLATGVITNDIEIHLVGRMISWNKFFNEYGRSADGGNGGGWEYLKGPNGQRMYALATFTPLLW